MLKEGLEALEVDLFASKKGNELYNYLKKDNISWHPLARKHINSVYNKYKKLLDDKFITQFPNDLLSCLWELKLLEYFQHQKQGEIVLTQKGKIPLPDYKWIIGGKTYYIEAICTSPGLLESYPYLNSELSSSNLVRDSSIGHHEYRERLAGAFREKASCKYDPYACDPNICKHIQKVGYKEVIGDDGYIIAVSMAKIHFFNQPNNWRVDLSCFYPCSPYTTLDIDRSGKVHDTYHAYIPSITKSSKQDALINVDIFANEKYSHVSAVLISHAWQVLFPDLSKYERSLIFGPCDNDFMLIHNPFALVPLKEGIIPVERELIATHQGTQFIISTVSPKKDPL